MFIECGMDLGRSNATERCGETLVDQCQARMCLAFVLHVKSSNLFIAYSESLQIRCCFFSSLMDSRPEHYGRCRPRQQEY